MEQEGIVLPGNAKPQLGSVSVDVRDAELGLGVPRGDVLGGGAPGWYSRGYLPHFDATGTVQAVTFRLADSLPQSVLREMEMGLRGLPADRAKAKRRKATEEWLDSGAGCCALSHPKLAALMQGTLLKWDGDRYRLLAWCVMPNHVHVLLETQTDSRRSCNRGNRLRDAGRCG